MAPSPADLLGTWTLTRTVQNRRAGERRQVRGTAMLTQDGPDRVTWHESGTMTWSDRSVPVQRTLLLHRDDAGWAVHFSDGRLFHRWAVGSPVEHPCAPDLYRGLVETEGEPVTRWTVVWEAQGPDKDYRMVSELTDRR